MDTPKAPPKITAPLEAYQAPPARPRKQMSTSKFVLVWIAFFLLGFTIVFGIMLDAGAR